MSDSYRKTRQEKFFRTTKSGCRIKIKQTVKYSVKIPKNVDVGEFTYMQTYNDMYSSFTINDLVQFIEEPTPVGVMIRTKSDYPQLQVIGYGPTHHLAMRDTFTQLINIVTNARKKNAEDWHRVL